MISHASYANTGMVQYVVCTQCAALCFAGQAAGETGT